MKFKFINETKIEIFNDKDEKVGHIFTPAGSGENCLNAIQVCGFSEAYDLWACGIFKHTKDIQLLFDNVKIKGDFNYGLEGCQKCFHTPCVCEDKKIDNIEKLIKELTPKQIEIFKQLREKNNIDKTVEFLINCQGKNPFKVKREKDLLNRIKYKNSLGNTTFDTIEELEK